MYLIGTLHTHMNHSHLIWKLTAIVKKHNCPLRFFEILEDRDFWLLAHSDKQIQRRVFFLTHSTSMIICYEGIYGLSDASYIQWAAYLLRVCAVSSELRYSLIFIFLSVVIFYSNTNMSCVLPYFFQLGDLSYFDVFLSRHLSCVMFLVTLFETPPITFFFLSTHFFPFNFESSQSILAFV